MADEKTLDRAREAVAEVAAGARDVVEDGLEEARDQFEDAAEEFERSARRTRREIRRHASRLGDVARERYGAAVDGARRGYERARKSAEDLTQDVNAYVRENPGKSILIAAGVGFALGLLLRGRRRDEI
jgi:ElaB/YqjD/DUF883 family membrane-anchored ribosome-binding protein